MDVAASESLHRPVSQTDSSSTHRRTRNDDSQSCNTQSSLRHTSSRGHDHHSKHSLRRHHHRPSTETRGAQYAGERSLQGEGNPPSPSTMIDVNRGLDAQEAQQRSLNLLTRSSCASVHSSHSSIQSHTRLPPRGKQGAQHKLSFTGPPSSAASEALRTNKALERSQEVAALLVKYSRSHQRDRCAEAPAAGGAPHTTGAAPPPPLSSGSTSSSSLALSEDRPVTKGSSASATDAAVRRVKEAHNASSSKRGSGSTFASQPLARQEAIPPPSPSSHSAATLLEISDVKPHARVRSWQKNIDAETGGSSLSHASSAHSAAQRVPPAVTVQLTSYHRSSADATNSTPSPSSARASNVSASVQMTLERPSSYTSGKGPGCEMEDVDKGSDRCGCERLAAFSLAGVPATAETAAAESQSPSACSPTLPAVVEVEHEKSLSRGDSSSAHQRPQRAERHAISSRKNPRHDSGASPPSAVTRSLTSSLSVAIAPSPKASEQRNVDHSVSVAASMTQSSLCNVVDAAPCGAHDSAAPRTSSASHRSTSLSRQRHPQVSVPSSSITGFEPSQLSTARRSTMWQSASRSYVPPDPLSEVSAQERQRLLDLPHHGNTMLGTSRLDITFEEDMKELYKQTHLVDPLLRSRPGRRMFYIPEQADLFGMYPEPPMTTDENGERIVQHLAPIPLKGLSFVPPPNAKASPRHTKNFTVHSQGVDDDHDTSDVSVSPPPPAAPASHYQSGKASGASASSKRKEAMAVVRPGRGLSSFVAGYGEEATAKNRGGLTPQRGRIVSDITAPYRRNTAASSALPSSGRCESHLHGALPLPCDRDRPPPASATVSSSDVLGIEGESWTSTPFGILRPAPQSQPCSDSTSVGTDCYNHVEVAGARVADAPTPLQDQRQRGNNPMVVLGKDAKSSYDRHRADVTAVVEPSPAVQTRTTTRPYLGTDAGSSRSANGRHGSNELISVPANLTVAQERTPVGSNSLAETDAASTYESAPLAFVTERLRDKQRRLHTGETAVAERATPLTSASETALMPKESVEGDSSSSKNNSRRTRSVVAGDPSDSERLPKSLRRILTTSKQSPIQQQEKLQQLADPEALAPVASGEAPQMLETAPSLLVYTAASTTLAESSPVTPVAVTSQHTDPQFASASEFSSLSPPLQHRRRFTSTSRVRPTSKIRDSPAESRMPLDASPVDTSLPLSTPPHHTLALDEDLPPPVPAPNGEPDSTSTADAPDGLTAANTRRYREAPLTRDRDRDSNPGYRGFLGPDAAAATANEGCAASATRDNTPALSIRSAFSSSCAVDGSPRGLSGLRGVPAFIEDGPLTDSVLSSQQERQLQLLQREQVFINMQILQLQRQQEQLFLEMQRIGSRAYEQPLQILYNDRGSTPSPSFTPASTPRISPTAQTHGPGGGRPATHWNQRAAGVASGTTPTQRRRSQSYNDSRGVREALRWIL